MSSVLRVAIIGAGSAGLAAAQQLLQVAPEHFAPVIFDLRDRVGGLWHYDAKPGPCTVHLSHGSHVTGRADWDGMPASAMYDGLFTNIPSDIMAFRDSPFIPNTPLFPQRAQVLEYLEQFARDQGLLRYLRTRTHIDRVVRTAHDPVSRKSKWRVTSHSLDNGTSTDEDYDFIVAANGRCTIPRVPVTPGLEHFRGRQVHSAWYRFPDEFRGERVLVVGNNSSGSDIARELCGGVKREFPGVGAWNNHQDVRATTVYQVYRRPELPPPMDYDPRNPDSPDWCRRINVVGTISRITPSGIVETTTGESLEIDTIIWATGYLYTFPYLDHSVEPFASHPVIPEKGDDYTEVVNDCRAASVPHNLDDWFLFYRHDQSICFLGLPNKIVPFPMAQLQARIAAHIWAGKIPPLPPAQSSKGPDDPARWKPSGGDTPVPLRNLSFGADSEEAYHDTMTAFLPGENSKKRPPSEQAYLEQGDGIGGGPHGHENWYQFAQWRRDRRRAGRKLRQTLVGY